MGSQRVGHDSSDLAGTHLQEWLPQWVNWQRICTPMQESHVRPLSQENHLEEEMATHFSILAWKIPWTEEPGRLQCMGSQRIGHD